MMRLPMVDCRSLIEFCKAFEQHKNKADLSGQSNHHAHSRGKKRIDSLNPLPHPFCHHSTFAAIDIIILLLAIVALAVLTAPYLNFIFRQVWDILPALVVVVADVIGDAPVAYVLGMMIAFGIAIAFWEIISLKARKCGNPYCKGLRKAVEFDIQLESEECLKYLPPFPKNVYGLQPFELGEDHKELEAELKRMAPLNGRTVLIFRAPCGCPAGRMEVWGPKRIRRIKK